MDSETLQMENGGTAGTPVCLIADDDEICQAIVRQFIGALGHIELVVASDGREALTQCMLRAFDLLIFDRKMPFIYGDKLIRHLRASTNPNSATPVILLSASTGDELRELGSHCPADMILAKPINRNDFMAAVRSLLAGPETIGAVAAPKEVAAEDGRAGIL